MAEPLERLTNLLALLLETKQPITLEQIANEMLGQYPTNDAARRGSFERDKSVLRDLGVPIEQTVLGGDQAGRTAYRIDRRRYELADLNLSDDERHALQVAVAAARTDDSWGQEGLWKLGVGSEQPALSVAATMPTSAALPPLREAVSSRSSARFRYREQERLLQPYGLLLRDGRWYVIGLDEAHAEVRTYRVDRIEGTVTIGAPASFTRPANFDIHSVFPADPKLLGDADAEVTRATVWVSATRALLVAAEVGEEAVVRRLDDGSIEVEVPYVNRVAFRSWLFGLTDNAVVVAPDELRRDTIAWLTALAHPSAGAA